jgi:hypothetical protein
MYYLVKLQHHHITEDFGTIDCNDPYDHYIGDTVERTNLRFVVIEDKKFEELCDTFIPDDPYDYEDVIVMCEFFHDHEVRRFLKCMKELSEWNVLM